MVGGDEDDNQKSVKPLWCWAESSSWRRMMNDVISGWLAKKGIELASSRVLKSLGEVDDMATFRKDIDDINNKLDRIIGAPFREARVLVREGEIEKAKDKAIQAFSLDPLNLPAYLLYARLLCFLGKYDVALDIYWDIVDQFTTKKDLVPSWLFEQYIARLLKTKINAGKRRFRYYNGLDFYATKVWCAEVGIAIRWRRKRKVMFLFESEDFANSYFTWDENVKINIPGGLGVCAITNRYVVFKMDADTFSCYDCCNGNKVRDLNQKEFTALFGEVSTESVSRQYIEIGKIRPAQMPAPFLNLMIDKGVGKGYSEMRTIIYDPCSPPVRAQDPYSYGYISVEPR